MKAYPKQSLGCSTVLGKSASAVDPKTPCKWVWAFINIMANLVNAVVSFTHNARTAQFVAFFVMMPCDSAARPTLASIRNHTKNASKKIVLFFHTHSHTPAAAAPFNH